MIKTATKPLSPKSRRSGPVRPVQWLGQVFLYGLFALFIGVFTQWPTYHPIGADQAVIKISVARLGEPVGECRRLTDEELAKLPPNMRDPIECPRERAPLTIEVDLNDVQVLRRVAEPAGLSRDGAAAIYERLVVPAGEQHLSVRFNNDVRPGSPTYERQATVNLAPGQVLVVDFDPDKNGIVMQ